MVRDVNIVAWRLIYEVVAKKRVNTSGSYQPVKVSGRAATPVKLKPSWDFSVPGLMYSSTMMFMGIAAMNTQVNLLFGVFGLMIGVLLVSGVISRIVLAKLTVRRGLPDAAVVGQPVGVGYEFVNSKRFWPSFSVQVAELDGVEAFKKQPHAYLLHAAGRKGGSVAKVQVEVTPKRRGLHALDRYQIATSFPFGFVKRAVIRHQDDSILVFPALARVDQRVLKLLRSAETAGVTVRPRRGGEDEFYGVKEYRPGENPRLIHWRRSAKLGPGAALVTREMTRVSPPRVMILVDTLLVDRTVASHAEVERTIAIAASLASEALEQGLMVGVATVGENGELVTVQASRGKRHRRDVLSALARTSLNTRVDARGLLERGMRGMRAGTTPVLVTSREREQSLAEQARGNMVVLSSRSATVAAWFEFGAEVDFSLCMPADQQPELTPPNKAAPGGTVGRRKG